MSSAKVNKAKIDTDMDEDKLKWLPEDSAVLSYRGYCHGLLLVRESHLNNYCFDVIWKRVWNTNKQYKQ